MAKHQEGDVIVDGIGRTFVIRRGKRQQTVEVTSYPRKSVPVEPAVGPEPEYAVAQQADTGEVHLALQLPRPLTLVVRHGEPLGGIEVRS